MKKKNFLRLLWLLPAAALVFLAGCTGQHASLLLDEVTTEVLSYDYEWTPSQDKDTVWLTCEQKLVYRDGDGQSHTLYPKAQVKAWPLKSTVYYAGESDPTPKLADNESSLDTSGTLPENNIRRQYFTLDDGQTIVAETVFETYTLPDGGVSISLPAMIPGELAWQQAEADAADGSDELYRITVRFVLPWSTASVGDSGSESLEVAYDKQASSVPDNLLGTDYATGYEWLNDNTLSLYVDKTETWSLSGTKTQRFSSPQLLFALSGSEDKALEVSDFDFAATTQSNASPAQETGNGSWSILRQEMTQEVAFSNGSETFSDVFAYPSYEAYYELDGQQFAFDLAAVFSERHRTAQTGRNEVTNTTDATVDFAGKVFTAAVVTVLTLKDGGGDEPDPDPDPDPEPSHGRIIDFAVTAVLDADGLAQSANITKKAVVIRYAKGYEWGVCAYEEAFPAQMTYTQSGYTAFNSAAQAGAGSDFRLARAVDKAQSIEWYAEDNSLIVGVDALTCAVLGWKNIVDGRYSAFINGYEGVYADDRQSLTLTAPDGSSKTFGAGN